MRSDFDQLITIPDYSHSDIIKLRMDTFETIDSQSNCKFDENILKQIIDAKM